MATLRTMLISGNDETIVPVTMVGVFTAMTRSITISMAISMAILMTIVITVMMNNGGSAVDGRGIDIDNYIDGDVVDDNDSGKRYL